MNRWSLPLRTWLLTAMVAVILAPLVSWIGVVIAFRGPLKNQQTPWEIQSRQAADTARQMIMTRRTDWEDPAFVRELLEVLERGGYSVGLVDAEGRLLFQSGSVDNMHALIGSDWQRIGVGGYGDLYLSGLVHGPDGTIAGMYVLARSRMDPLIGWVFAAAVAGVTLALVLLVWWVGRSFNMPIRALAAAAHKVHRGELDFRLPDSRVRELNELGAAFGAMRDGLRESLVRQSELEQERRLFVAAVAHDLRTPLSSVRGYLEGLRDGVAKTPEQVSRYVNVALEKAGALERLIETFFAYTRTEYLSQPPQLEELELGELLTSAVEALRPAAQNRSVEIVLEGPAEPCLITGDWQMLIRVVDNLMENAIRHTPPGGRVTVGWGPGHGAALGPGHEAAPGWAFWVQDTGPGIPPGDLQQIFEPLFRGDRARGTRTGGAGLGLTIARRLVEAHGGQITAENRQGTRFTVMLPRQEPS